MPPFSQSLSLFLILSIHSSRLPYSDGEHNISVNTPAEQYSMNQARKARQRVEALSDELNMDAGISKSDVSVQRRAPTFD